MPHPLRLLIDKGPDIDVADYIRLSEYHVWSLIESWQNHSDKILNDLSTRLMQRKRFRGEDYNPDRLSRFQVKCQNELAELVRNHLPFDINRDQIDQYYVVVDDPSRVTYKLYNWGVRDGKAGLREESIWLREPNAVAQPIELIANPIFKALQLEYPQFRMTFPHEIHDEVRKMPYFNQ